MASERRAVATVIVVAGAAEGDPGPLGRIIVAPEELILATVESAGRTGGTQRAWLSWVAKIMSLVVEESEGDVL